jgi:hypothetical protein
MIVYMIAMLVVHVTVVQIASMIVMFNCDVSTIGRMFVFMICVRVATHFHLLPWLQNTWTSGRPYPYLSGFD